MEMNPYSACRALDFGVRSCVYYFISSLRPVGSGRRLLVRVEQRQPGSGLLQGLLNLGPAENRRWDTGRGEKE